LLAFLKAAETLKIPMALATGGGKANIDFILDGLSIRTYFQSVLGAGDVKHGKPNPEIYLKSADALGLLPEQCFVFEDALPGIEAAHRAGMRIIGIATTHCVAFLRKVPGVIVAAKNFERLSPKQFLSLRAET